ncbi:ribonuclease H1 domain-containing protein [Clostridium algidicarnis]|uniref:ribonuclease H1 domain-containing protein n=1 Tax=Clostridium algidicarnis TaxID=37659 RepID=UPI001C0BB7BF|nr:ribonuclease H family protein [Clostridium algidicarnis]MBU3202607.1 ribonuclease H family protein [Clostridium algidicarnis]MBU3210761.1 ribonuclease H family protein [Clostridium algidicarnis]MBU3222731.1 ribonuclease H family protein [Clostridium algidicarnis]
MGKKFYAIKEGYDSLKGQKVTNEIVTSWNQCLSYVKGVKSAKYKSFESLVEAENFLKSDSKLLKKGIDEYPKNIPQIYVDGSFNIVTGVYGYGFVVIIENEIIYVEKGSGIEDSEKCSRQIAGELKAALKGTEYALKEGYKNIIIFHDYEGISHHATGYWERKGKSSQDYYNFMNYAMKENGLEIIFVKVDSHTLDLYNELADELAKSAAGVEIKNVFNKLLKKQEIKVINQHIIEDIGDIVSESSKENIKVSKIFNEGSMKESKNQNMGLQTINSVEDENEILYAIEKIKNLSLKDTNKYLKSLDIKLKDNIIINLLK